MGLTIIRPCVNDRGESIPVGTVVEYACHVPGGMVRIRWKGQVSIIHPGATEELGRP